MCNCQLCEREVHALQFHHLIPKQLHSKKKYLRQYTKLHMNTHGIMICKDCHKQIHQLFTHAYLGENLSTLSALKQNDKMRKFLKWVRKQTRYIV